MNLSKTYSHFFLAFEGLAMNYKAKQFIGKLSNQITEKMMMLTLVVQVVLTKA